MKLYHVSFSGLIIRFYLMMAVVLIAGYSGMWMISLLALPIFLSCMLGMKITMGQHSTSDLKESLDVRPHTLRVTSHAQHAA
jgi:hypothetical protein